MEDSPGIEGCPPMGPPLGLPELPECPPKYNGSRPNNRHSKRLTLNFPINLPNLPTDSASASPGSMTPATHSSARQSPALPPNLGTPLSFEEPDDGNSLLRAIASQERKVLELREELHNAESELATLKKQWASSERTRKRTEINHHAEPLIPLKSPDRPTDDSSHHRNESTAATTDSSSASASARLSRDLDNRRHSMRAAIAAATAGTSVSANGRRVFQGSHARTLSLLSAASDPPHRKPVSDPEQDKSDTTNDRIGRLPRAATLPSVDRSNKTTFQTPDNRRQPAEDTLSQWRNTMPPPPSREALVRTGKQMASDLREGLWTFFEDIRQATVGDEGINGTGARVLPPASATATTRKRGSPNSNGRLSVQEARSARSSPSPSSRQGSSRGPSSGKETKSTDIDASFWNEFGIDTPVQNGRGSDRKTGNSLTNEGPGPDPSLNHSTNLLDAEAGADTWDWDSSTPQPTRTKVATNNSHTPSSSRSTLEFKQQSPQTQASSSRTSASFGDWNPALSAIPDPSVSDGIPWPAITKEFSVSSLTRTASNLMDEWERSLSPSPSRLSEKERKHASLNLPLQFGKDGKRD